ncbi:MAG: hypothetical protein IJ454_03660 [Clostridia bacterium]|nr:hypothetical protein [Clostridia bacterium]
MKRIMLIVCVIICLASSMSAYAGTVADMLGGNQDYIIMGSVKDIKNDTVVVTIDHVLGMNSSDMIGTDVTVSKFTYSYCEDHSTSEFRNPIVSDNIVIDLTKDSNGGYSMANCAYKVDSNEYASCKIIVHEDIHEEDCIKDLLEATCFIRSNAKVSEFEFDEEGRIYAVYPQTAEQCVRLVDDEGSSVVEEEIPDTLPTVPPAAPGDAPIQNNGTYTTYAVIILAVGVLAGMCVSWIVMVKRK